MKNSIIKKQLQILLAVLAIAIGLYPLLFLALGMHFDLLDSKSKEILASTFWNIAFYMHISFGGIALLIGWTGFMKNLRSRNIKVHRIIGKIYVISALLSAVAGIYIGFFSNGGLIASTGFISMGIIWFYTTGKAYLFIRVKNILAHEEMMLYSYAICFAGVTFRIWIPFLSFLFEDSDMVYKIVAWWCWIPNLYVAYILNRKKEKILELKILNKLQKI